MPPDDDQPGPSLGAVSEIVGRSPRRVWLVGSGLVIIGLLAIIGLGWWILQPVDPADQEALLLRVEEGDSVAAVAAELEHLGVVRSGLAFRLLARWEGATIQTGLFHVSPADRPIALLHILAAGTVSEKQLTFLEGWRLEEIAQRLVEAELVASVEAFTEAAVVTAESPAWLMIQFELKPGDTLEGFLFPDTYRFSTESDLGTILEKFLDTFAHRTEGLALTYADVNLAAIVEREALFDEDRAPIAGVYANRLALGMKLDADPTVQYAKANALNGCSDDPIGCATRSSDRGGVWWPTVTVSDYEQVVSEFNTYRVGGLPPTPIANPSLASLQAAHAPSDHDFLYFLHDAEGRTHFAETAAQHVANKRQYLQTTQ